MDKFQDEIVVSCYICDIYLVSKYMNVKNTFIVVVYYQEKWSQIRRSKL